LSGRGDAVGKSEAAKKRSDVERLRGLYRYTKYGLAPAPSSTGGSQASAAIFSASAAFSMSTSSAPPPVKMEVEDAELARILPTLEDVVGFSPRQILRRPSPPNCHQVRVGDELPRNGGGGGVASGRK
jgi:hypothetical protein